MIRHALDPVRLRTDIEALDPRWFSKAARRTAKFVRLGRYEEASTIWSDAKPAFMLAQMNKCAFCERVFTGPEESRIEMDLEHFRPKSSVKAWPAPQTAAAYPRDTGGDSPNGYFWLAYDTANYLASCKICNTEHKSNFFPIAGPRCTAPGDAAALAAEAHYLPYPLGDADADPETLITFTGTVARPVAMNGRDHQRAMLVIDFFGLNRRDQLHYQRAEMIERFGNALLAIAEGRDSAADRTYAGATGNPMLPHAGCVRAFARLWRDDEASARRILAACRDLLAQRLLQPGPGGPGIGIV